MNFGVNSYPNLQHNRSADDSGRSAGGETSNPVAFSASTLATLSGAPGYRSSIRGQSAYFLRFFCSFSLFAATRALTSFFTRAAGRGLSTGKRIVPLEVGKRFSSSANFLGRAPGKKLQWFANAA